MADPWRRRVEIGDAVLLLGDAIECLPHVRADCVIADPPYGIGYKPLRGSNGSKMWGDEVVTGDAQEFDPSPFAGFGKAVLWGATAYSNRLPQSYGWLVWDKCPRGPRDGFIYSHCELAWTNFLGRIQKISLEWEGSSRRGEPFLHPTQKPVDVMRWCIEQCKLKPGSVILDPYAGSFTLAVAATQMGFPSISIEIEPKYFEIGVERITNAYRQGKLFEEPRPKPVQETLI